MAWASPPAPADAAAQAGASIDLLKKDASLYVGEGQAEFAGADRGEAREKARDRALADLSKKIKTEVEVIARDELGYQVKNGRSSDDEAFQQLINSRTDEVLSGYQDQDFLDYPEAGLYTIVVSVDKAKVDEETRVDLARKLEKVTGFIKEAAAFKEKNSFASSLRSYLNARELLGQFFGAMPVSASLDGQSVELGAHVDSRLEELVGGITLTALNADVKYTAEGKPRGVVAVGANFQAAKGAKAEPAVKLPLYVAFSKGDGRLDRAQLVTDHVGNANIPLDWVNPAAKEAALEVTLDPELLKGMPERAARPNCVITLSRSKSVAYAIRGRVDDEAAASPQGLERGLRELLGDAGYGAVKVALAASEEGPSHVYKARDAHADYLLILDLSAQTSDEASLGLYSARAVSSAAMLDALDGSEVFTSSGPSDKGFGSSAHDAGWEAMGKLNKRLLRLVQDKIKAVR
jgi:hypothetical protein